MPPCRAFGDCGEIGGQRGASDAGIGVEQRLERIPRREDDLLVRALRAQVFHEVPERESRVDEVLHQDHVASAQFEVDIVQDAHAPLACLARKPRQ